MKVSDLIYTHRKGQHKTTLTVPHGSIQFDVFPDTKSFFVLWIQRDEDDRKLLYLPHEERDLHTSASTVMHHPIFNALYQEQQVVAVPKDLFFSISNVVLVFTDIVDSTILYTNLGDGEAFRLVKKHFQVLFAAFTKRGGRVVKTIGDAVMASFTTGRSALQSVADAMELLPSVGRRPDNQRFLEIRVGLHCGKATVVPLNGVNDYFGQTTNIAAKVQSVAKASECFVTEAVLESSPDARECYNEIISPGSAFVATPLTQLKLKGLERQVHARGFRWVKRSLRESETMSSYNSFSSYSNRRSHTQTSLRGANSVDAGLHRGNDGRVSHHSANFSPHNSSWELFAEK
jgi:class 3 adenylate cyclase